MQHHKSSLCCLLICVVQTGAKFYKPLSALLPAIAAGMTYTPVTRADLAKSYPAAGWNESSAAASRMAAPIAAPRAAAAPAASRAPAISIPAALSRQPVAAAGQSMRSSSAGGGGRAAAAPGSKAWEQGLQQLLGRGDVKWRAVMPSGDRLGPFSQVELLGWLVGGGRAPKGVSREDARDAAADPGKLKICGIASKDYNMQKLPGESRPVMCVVTMLAQPFASSRPAQLLEEAAAAAAGFDSTCDIVATLHQPPCTQQK